MYMYSGGHCTCHQCPHMIIATKTSLNFAKIVCIKINEEEGESLRVRLTQQAKYKTGVRYNNINSCIVFTWRTAVHIKTTTYGPRFMENPRILFSHVKLD